MKIRDGRRARLPFYSAHELLDLKIEAVDAIERAFVVSGPEIFTWLDGTAQDIDDINEAESLKLSAEHVLDYFRWWFFCRRSRGALLVDAPTSIIDHTAGPERLTEVQAMLVPLALTNQDKGFFFLRARIAYEGTLSSVPFRVHPSGTVAELAGEKPLTKLDGLLVLGYPSLISAPSDDDDREEYDEEPDDHDEVANDMGKGTLSRAFNPLSADMPRSGQDAAAATPTRLPSIFLSHSHADKAFVHRLARDLSSHGVRVWVDEAEMRVGDSLIEKITASITEMDYLGVVISPQSARSEWVEREIEIAMTDDVAGRSVKILPLVLRGGEVPSALAGKLFADFTSELKYATSLNEILLRLGVAMENPDQSSDRLSELGSSSPLLALALSELRSGEIAGPTADALVSSKIADVDLSDFLSLAAREVTDSALFSLAISIPRYIDERGVGHEALDYCLRSGALEDWQIASVGMHMRHVKTQGAIEWCHGRLVSVIKSDDHYHSFLVAHIETVVDLCYDQMAAYLLAPNRGPAGSNMFSFDLAIRHGPDAWPFQNRWIEWIKEGYFDEPDKEGSESARTLYLFLNDHYGEARFVPIAEAIQKRVVALLKSLTESEFRGGMHHLLAMADAKYRGAGYMLEHTPLSPGQALKKEGQLYALIRAALQAVVAYNSEPDNREREALVERSLDAVRDADKEGVTAYWIT